ncbi:MAG: Inner rane amino-acid transporter permease protein YecS [Planctomycetota bacterium]
MRWHTGVFVVFCLLSRSTPAHADLLDEIRARGVLRWGADEEGGGPFVYRKPGSQELAGFEPELATLIAKAIGVKAEFVQCQWDKLPATLDLGEIDIVLNGYEWTPIRAQHYGTSVPYYIYELQLLGRRNDTQLQSLPDLLKIAAKEPVVVSALTGSAAETWIRNYGGSRIRIAGFDGVTDAMKAVELGQDGIRANMQDLPIWTFYERDFPQLRAVDQPVGQGFYVALTRKDSPELLQLVNSVFLAGLQDGSLRKIFTRERMWNETQTLRGLEVDPTGNFRGFTQGSTEDLQNTSGTSSLSRTQLLLHSSTLLLQAAGTTVLLSITSMPIAVALGLLLALARMYGPRWQAICSQVLVELLRGTPLALQLFLIFFVIPGFLHWLLPELQLGVSRFPAAILALALNYAACEAEVFRSGFQAVPQEQMEAALSLGMNRSLALRRIIIPQAFRRAVPNVTNDFIALFKDTAVCSLIGVIELSKGYYIQAQNTMAVVELGAVTAVLYLAMSYPLSILSTRLESRLDLRKRSSTTP